MLQRKAVASAEGRSSILKPIILLTELRQFVNSFNRLKLRESEGERTHILLHFIATISSSYSK
jgi:hypothetical protein